MHRAFSNFLKIFFFLQNYVESNQYFFLCSENLASEFTFIKKL